MNYQGYCLRVDALDGYADKLRMLPACLDYKSMIALRHSGSQGENPHYHAVIQTTVAGQAFRVRMRKIFDQGKGNGHMSIKPWDGSIDAISYLFHEDEESAILVLHNISDETVAQAKARNRQVTEMVQASKAKAAWHLEGIVLEQIKNRPMPRGGFTESYIGQQLILTALRAGKYVPQPWHIRAMTQRIQFAMINGDMESEEEFAARLADQIFYRQ